MGTEVSADNTSSVVETIRNDALGVFFSLFSWGLAAALGGWLGNLTQEQVCSRAPATIPVRTLV